MDELFFLLYWIEKPNKTESQLYDIGLLKEGFNIDSIIIIDYDLTLYTFPNFFNEINNNNIEWLISTNKEGYTSNGIYIRGNYAWEFADIPEMIFYNIYGKYIKSLKYIWTFEFDIGWTNNLQTILLNYILFS